MSDVQLKDGGRLVNMAGGMWVVREGIESRDHGQIPNSSNRSPVSVETRDDASSVVKHLELVLPGLC